MRVFPEFNELMVRDESGEWLKDLMRLIVVDAPPDVIRTKAWLLKQRLQERRDSLFRSIDLIDATVAYHYPNAPWERGLIYPT